MLQKDEQDAKPRAEVLEEEKEIKKIAAKKVAAADGHYDAYRAKVKNDMASLCKAYELAVNAIGATSLPIDDAAASSDDFFLLF
jgi:hypothetical protein